jgi:CDP-diacylglycerol--glycerol-3-phosphate 3-phosphatidyltransferase
VFQLNLPNALTVLRILLVPVVVVALLDETPNGDAIAAGVFALAAFTDTLDGYIARQRNAITTFGKLMDPIADKLLVAASLIALVSLDRLAAWIAMVIIAREFAVTGLRLIAATQDVVISASIWGKVKTTVQVAAIIALIVDDPPHTVTTVLVACAVAVTIWSGIEYFIAGRDLLREPA